MICLHVRIDYLCYFLMTFLMNVNLRLDTLTMLKVKINNKCCHWSLLLKVWILHWGKTKKCAACPSGTCLLGEVQHSQFQATVSHDLIVFILVSQTVWLLSWMLEDFLLLFLNVFRTSLLGIVLQFKLNHKQSLFMKWPTSRRENTWV